MRTTLSRRGFAVLIGFLVLVVVAVSAVTWLLDDPAGPPASGSPIDSRLASAFPDDSTTGVPAGTTLTPYTGPCTITSTRTLSGVDAMSCSAILIMAPNVVIENSRVPRVDASNEYGSGGAARGYSVTITDSEVRAGEWSEGALWGYNITATRVDVTGGQHSFHCNDNCVVEDSWLHEQYNPDGQSYHNNAFISNGGSNMVVRGNTLHCTAKLNATDGGCTADVSLFGDFAPIKDVTIDGNLLKSNNDSISYCLYGGHEPSKAFTVASGVVVTDNVFERGPNNKCGAYGPVTSFQARVAGNLWSGNVWDDGGAIRP